MHDYSIDRHPKEKVIFGLAFIAIIVSPILQKLLESTVKYLAVNVGWGSSTIVAIPVFALFVFLFFLFNKYLWRVRWLRKILLVPDLNGQWKCEGLTVLKNGKAENTPWEATLTITQSWSKILIHLRTQQSESKSISASISHDQGVGYRLLYQYNNNPNIKELDLYKHSGAVELCFEENVMSGSGSYYTDKYRTTVGTMKLIKER